MLTSFNSTAVKISVPQSILNKFTKNLAATIEQPTTQINLLKEIQKSLNDLLNYKQKPAPALTAPRYPTQKPVGYGLPDLSYFNPHSEADRAAVKVLLETAIMKFEPRLNKVHISDGVAVYNRILSSMHFRINAELARFTNAAVVLDILIYPVVDHVVVDHIRH